MKAVIHAEVSSICFFAQTLVIALIVTAASQHCIYLIMLFSFARYFSDLKSRKATIRVDEQSGTPYIVTERIVRECHLGKNRSFAYNQKRKQIPVSAVGYLWYCCRFSVV